MKQTFTNSKRAYLFLLLLIAVFTSQVTNAQAVTEIITDYNGYWKSGVGNINPVKPENSHDLLSFTYNGVRYSTGVNDALLATNGETFSPQLFMALNMENMSGTPSQETYVGVGQLYDGVNNGPSSPPPFNSLPFYLTDGVQGLNIGTCATNIPVGYVSFQVTDVSPEAIGDGIPDILITQVAQPSGATDAYSFKDQNGVTVGNAINIVLNNITPVGNWMADFYKVTSNPMVIPAGFVNTERPIRLWAADFADFGITPANILNIDSFVINLKGTTDIAFIAYNFATAVVTPLTPGISLLKEGTYVDTNGDCVASAGDTINYTFRVSNTGQTPLTNIVVTDPNVTVLGNPINLAPGASNQANFTASYVLTQADIDAGAVYNQAFVTAFDAENDATVNGESHDPTPISQNSPFYNAECEDCTVVVLPQTPTVNVLAATTVEGCGVDGLQLAYSETAVNITLAQFLAAGGSISVAILNPIITYSDVQTGTCPTVITRTFSVGSACLASVNVTQQITINDTTLPTASNPANITTEDAEFPAPDTTVVTDATDNCGDVVVAFVNDSEPAIAGCIESIVRTYSVTDTCGNMITVTQNIIRNTSGDPVLPTLADVVGTCSATVTIPSATDGCGSPVLGTTTDPLQYDEEGTYTVTFSFDFGNGDVQTATQTVIVDADATPSAPVLETITAECIAVVPAPTVIDTCTAAVITGTTNDVVKFSAEGTYTINWTFDYGNGVTVTAPQTVILDDVTDPAIPTLAPLTAECSISVSAPTTTDNCVGTVTGTTTDPTTYNVAGTYTITWTFDDGNGNAVTADQQVTVTTTGEFTAPTLTTVTAQCSIVVDAPSASDSCGTAVLGTTTDPVSFSAQGTYTINWSFTNAEGVTVTAQQTVIVDDTTDPGVLGTIDPLTSECSITVTAPVALDNCAGEITGTTTSPLTYNELGTYTIVWTFDDGNGNVITREQSVTVNDLTDPIQPTLPTITEACSVSVTAPVTTDNCAGDITGTTSDPTSYATEGTYTITWTFTDPSGNNVTANQTVIVTPAAVITLQASAPCNAADQGIESIDLAAMLPAGIPTGGIWTDVDNSGALQGTNFEPVGVAVGSYTIRYTVLDGTCSRTVEIEVNVDDDCGIVLPCGNIEVFNAFSPNGDGVNDEFYIQSIDEFACYPTNSVEIYNRYGVLVYETKQYDNAGKSFKGISEGRANVGDELPTGTYFYVVQYTTSDGTTVKSDGYLYLSR